MIPQSVAAVVAFLLFVAPGLLFELLFERRLPGLRGSAFRETGRVVLVSLGCSLTAVALLAASRWVVPYATPDASRWAHRGRYPHYFENHVGVVGFGLLAETVVACMIAFGAYWFFVARRHKESRIRQQPLLWTLMHEHEDAALTRRLLVRAQDGTFYLGTAAIADYDDDQDLQAIALGGPLLVGRPGQVPSAVTEGWDRLVIPMSSISEMWIRWESVPPTS